MSKEFSDLNSIYVRKNLFALNHSYSMKMFFGELRTIKERRVSERWFGNVKAFCSGENHVKGWIIVTVYSQFANVSANLLINARVNGSYRWNNFVLLQSMEHSNGGTKFSFVLKNDECCQYRQFLWRLQSSAFSDGWKFSYKCEKLVAAIELLTARSSKVWFSNSTKIDRVISTEIGV